MFSTHLKDADTSSAIFAGALTAEFKHVNLSLTYDALTIYPKFQEFEPNSTTTRLAIALTKCGQLGFTKVTDGTSTKENTQYNTCHLMIRLGNTGFEQYVHRDDAIHPLFHNKDKFNLDDTHSHIRFLQLIDREKLNAILLIFVEGTILSKEEHAEFLRLFDERYAKCRKALDDELARSNPAATDLSSSYSSEIIVNSIKLLADTRAIIQLILKCTANDILANLHAYLLSEKFDYLRQGADYRGTDAKGQAINTSKAWADIQKAFSARIADNVIDSCGGKFNQEVGASCSRKFKKDLPFFSLLRVNPKMAPEIKSSIPPFGEEPCSPSFTAFREGDADTCKKRSFAFFAPYLDPKQDPYRLAASIKIAALLEKEKALYAKFGSTA